MDIEDVDRFLRQAVLADPWARIVAIFRERLGRPSTRAVQLPSVNPRLRNGTRVPTTTERPILT